MEPARAMLALKIPLLRFVSSCVVIDGDVAFVSDDRLTLLAEDELDEVSSEASVSFAVCND